LKKAGLFFVEDRPRAPVQERQMRASVGGQLRAGRSWAIRLAATLALGAVPAWTAAADAARGAALYLQTDRGVRSCVACHGPDPGFNRNNLLRAADQPLILTGVLSRVSAMAFLDPELTPADREDVAAYLGATARLAAPGAPLWLWPATLDFGRLGAAGAFAVQTVRVSNVSSAPMALGVPRASDARIDLGHDCPAQLAPASTCELLVRVRSGATGTLRAAVQIDTGAFPVPMVVGVLANVSSSPTSALAWRGDPARLQWSDSPSTRTLTLHNPGPMPAVLELASIVGPGASQFRLEGGCARGSVLIAGTSCELSIGFTPGDAAAQATLQLRSDQANPASVLLLGDARPAPEAPAPLETALPVDSGGGCSAGPPNRRATDPLLWVLAALAALVLGHRRRPG
jgi:mono/diheme cytochrome c family protein